MRVLIIELRLFPIFSTIWFFFIGLDRLKSALMALGLKCGGTLEERANRLFSTKGKSLDDLDPSLQAKSKNKASTAYKNAKEFEKQKEVASMEAQVYRYFSVKLIFLSTYYI